MAEVLVGYRVVARGPHGDTTGQDEEGRPVRLVRIREGDRTGELALAAWLGAEGAHLQRVLDLGTAPNGDLVAVLEDLPHTLTALIDASPLEAGEAVTVLVPVAEALAVLHGAGIAHGALGPAAIALTPSGAPVLLLPRTASRCAGAADGSALVADRRALAALVRLLMPPPLPDPLLQAVERDPGGALIDALFDLAEPQPVRLDRRPADRDRVATPARLVAPLIPARDDVESGADVRPAGATPAGGAAGGLRRLRAGLATVRLRVWLIAAASLVALAAALVLLPGHGAAARVPLEPGTGTLPPSAAPSGGPSRSPSPATSPSSVPAPSPSVVAGGTDPVRAASALLSARARCLAGGRSSCLSAVDAPGSPVDGLDRAALAAGVDPVLPSATTPELLRSGGASAVLAVGRCTVLEVRGPDGWRLRDVVAPAPPGAQMPSEPAKSPSSSRVRTALRKRAASAPSTIRWS